MNNIKTKLNIGDKMFVVSKFSKQVKVDCKYCNGTGNLKVLDKEFKCSECYGDGFETEWETEKYNVEHTCLIGQYYVEEQIFVFIRKERTLKIQPLKLSIRLKEWVTITMNRLFLAV